MKNNIILKHILVAVIMIVAMFTANAQSSAEVEKAVNEIIGRYDGKDNVTCLTVTKGSGLNLVKAMLNQEFGRSFMKGVKSITLIEYTDASQETCIALRKDMDVFMSMLQEFDITEEKDFSDNDFIRCFASVSEGDILSDFVIAMEDKETKVLMYMAGTIKVD